MLAGDDEQAHLLRVAQRRAIFRSICFLAPQYGEAVLVSPFDHCLHTCVVIGAIRSRDGDCCISRRCRGFHDSGRKVAFRPHGDNATPAVREACPLAQVGRTGQRCIDALSAGLYRQDVVADHDSRPACVEGSERVDHGHGLDGVVNRVRLGRRAAQRAERHGYRFRIEADGHGTRRAVLDTFDEDVRRIGARQRLGAARDKDLAGLDGDTRETGFAGGIDGRRTDGGRAVFSLA